MEKTKLLIEELTMTKKEVAQESGVSYTLLNKFENGQYPGKKLRKNLIKVAREKAAKLMVAAQQAELEAA